MSVKVDLTEQEQQELRDTLNGCRCSTTGDLKMIMEIVNASGGRPTKRMRWRLLDRIYEYQEDPVGHQHSEVLNKLKAQLEPPE